MQGLYVSSALLLHVHIIERVSMYKFAPDPLEIENPEFKCSAPMEYAIEVNIAISSPDSGDKFARCSTLSFRTDNMGGYPMEVGMRLHNGENKWYTQDDVGAITIRFRGDYEASTLREFVQHAGLMATVIYGPVHDYDNEENDDAIRK